MLSQSHLVLPFLSFPLRRKVDQAPVSDLLRTPLSTWASVLDQNLTPPSVPSPGLAQGHLPGQLLSSMCVWLKHAG